MNTPTYNVAPPKIQSGLNDLSVYSIGGFYLREARQVNLKTINMMHCFISQLYNFLYSHFTSVFKISHLFSLCILKH